MRRKEFHIEDEGDGLKKLTARMEDEYHHICLYLWIEHENLNIVRIQLEMLRYPEPGCTTGEPNLQKLVGTSLYHHNFRHRLLRTVGGERGCFHVLELLHEAQDYSRACLWDQRPDARGHYTISAVSQEDRVRCIAFKKK